MSSGNAVLVVSKHCPACVKAKQIIYKLMKEGYLVRVEGISLHPDVTVVPTLKVGGKRIKGLLSEEEYREILKDWKIGIL